MDPNKLLMVQLKAELEKRDLPTDGIKKDFMRLNQDDPNGRWLEEIVRIGISGTAPDETTSGENRATANIEELVSRYRYMLELEREIELLRRELEIARRENEQTRKKCAPASGERSQKRKHQRYVRELVGFFARTFRKWEQQVNLYIAYHLDNDCARLLIGNKLKGKVKD
ncbi:hypothetical protein P5V15_002701 [Pogonomyrmex californicus]